MRLKYLKLAGFKSFVDPTKIMFTQAMSAVVGPNGCGKSNIIDAVRWVLGESSAKNLRGDGMTDVIFNGSSARKPVSLASVELLFDNNEGKAAGPWASFNEIAIKRQVSRDGQSDYFVNGQKCRRRDISDLLSGTGLGPRSYSIIEQGTISRLVESKPQDLRVFIEEAAGISKYKERKRDTENRIRHSRENLSRLADLRHELAQQIDSLESQAKLAQDYSQLKQSERSLNQNIIVLRWKTFFAELAQVDLQLTQGQTALSHVELDFDKLQQQEDLRSSTLEQQRLGLTALNGQCHGVETDIARLQLSIEHLTENQQLTENKRGQLQLKLETLTGQRQMQQEALATADSLLQQSTVGLPAFESAQTTLQHKLNAQEVDVDKSELAFNEYLHQKQRLNGELLLAKQGTERINQDQIKLGSQVELLKQKQLELLSSQQQLNPQVLEQEVEQQQRVVLAQQSSNDDIDLQVNSAAHAIEQHRLHLADGRLVTNELINRLTTLELIVEQHSKQQDQGLTQHYTDVSQLWQLLRVESRWQSATELVLGRLLTAYVVEQLTDITSLPPHAIIHPLAAGASTIASEVCSSALPRLADHLNYLRADIKPTLENHMQHVFCADDVAQARMLLGELASYQSVVTPCGYWLGHGFVISHASNDEASNSSLLALQQQAEQLRPQIIEAEQRLTKLKQRLIEGQQSLSQIKLSKGQSDSELLRLKEHMIESKQRWMLQQQQWQHIVAGLGDIDAQLTQNKQLSELDKAQKHTYKQQTLQLGQQLADTEEQLKLAQGTRQIGKQQVKSLQVKLVQAQEKVHQQQLLVQKHQLKHNACQTQLGAIATQYDDLALELRQLAAHQSEQLAPLETHQQQLKTGHSQLISLKQQQQLAQQQLDASTHASSESSQKLRGFSQDKLQQQTILEKLRVKKETLKVKISAQEQALNLSQRDVSLLAQQLLVGSESKSWSNELAVIRDKLAQMGAINLTAIEQYNEQKSRLDYLNGQNDDLEQGLKTLESAIRKIDRESRDKFKRTFDSVNADFKRLFPKVFGGGSAQLTLTDSDLLLAGVSIMAQPPGKKNSTIHLLSGGEKALTALSLVFAIFQLNPAPFCMLDEVDAPLDDANVDRFCNLVKEMSEKVQFIYITHNKVSMEMATQLTGVTMQEAGVSRVVSVDVDAAVSLAQQ